MTLLLEARQVGFALDGRSILAGIDLDVTGGSSVAVVGPSGSGKTTLLGLLSGLSTPTSGEVRLDGRRLDGIARPSEGVALVLQGYGLVSLLSAAETIEVALRAAGWTRERAGVAAREGLRDVGLEAQAGQLVEELSGGQQQRTAVARALALRPRLVIADEPTAELDAVARAMVLARLFDVSDRGGGLVLATHDPEVADRCDQILDLRAGPRE
jgi:putative ABC transport system ATP-binding protein